MKAVEIARTRAARPEDEVDGGPSLGEVDGPGVTGAHVAELGGLAIQAPVHASEALPGLRIERKPGRELGRDLGRGDEE